MNDIVSDLRDALRGKMVEDAIRKGAPKWFSRYVARYFQVAYAKTEILCTDRDAMHAKSRFFVQWCSRNLTCEQDDDPTSASFGLHMDCQDRRVFLVAQTANRIGVEAIELAARRSAWFGQNLQMARAYVVPCVIAETWRYGAEQYAKARGVPCFAVIRTADDQEWGYDLGRNLVLRTAGSVEMKDLLAQRGLPLRISVEPDDATVAERVDSRATLCNALRLLIQQHWFFSALKEDAQEAVLEKIGLQTDAAQQALQAGQWKTAYKEAAHTLRTFMEISTT